TNRLDSYAVADLIVADFAGEAKPGPDGFDELAASHKLNPVSFDDWLTIKEAEEQAAAGPAPRRKFSTVADMLATLQKSRKRA
ncbi:MAG: ferredoxin-NADP reductase, partial [Rhodospirillales bacterium]|nr:ferredoxin-NADP reductase [Rhodospirillales bacterium]